MDSELIRERSFSCRRPCRERKEDPPSPSAEWRGPPEEQRQRIEELRIRIEAELEAEEAQDKEHQLLAIKKQASSHKQGSVRTSKAWTEQEIVWLQLLWEERNPNEKQNTFARRAGYFLDRSADSVICQLKQLGLRFGPARKRRKAI